MHKEYMPVIREFRCFEDTDGQISGFEVDYWIKPVLDTRLQSARFWKTVGRRGANATPTGQGK